MSSLSNSIKLPLLSEDASAASSADASDSVDSPPLSAPPADSSVSSLSEVERVGSATDVAVVSVRGVVVSTSPSLVSADDPHAATDIARSTEATTRTALCLTI